ncbi:MAG: hypothetical protein GY757_06085 [bacterium]|nr:hypothetical protein [bacterium]
MNVKTIAIFCVIFLCVFQGSILFPGKVATLTEVLKPASITAADDQLYIVTDSVIHLYSLKDFKVIKKFGKQGAGPGEYRRSPTLTVYQDFLLLNSFDKALFFTRDGEFQKEIKTSIFTRNIKAVGSNFACFRLKRVDNSSTMFVLLLDKEQKTIKEIGKKILRKRDLSKLEIEGSKNYFGFTVSENHLFYSGSPTDFAIEVFDHNGKKLREIKKDYKKNKISGLYKEAFKKRYKKNNKRIVASMQGKVDFKFGEYFPPINELLVNDGKIYTFHYSNDLEKKEVSVMDVKGKFLKKVTLPAAKYYSISNDTFYYLKENEDKEVWELYVENI